MDEWTLNDLLECSVCLERLDTSSKVLPCQHTFCKKCLEEIVSTHKELRCPECRILVEIKIEDLPPNVLLMRILEGMRNSAPKKRNALSNRLQGGPSPAPATVQHMAPIQQQQVALHAATISSPDTRVHAVPKQHVVQPNQPCAKAQYDYFSTEPGDLCFKKGDIILLRKKIDNNWYHGESGGKQGVFPLTYVQVITPLPSHVPQCKALYDFRMTNDDEEGCLTFNKGEVITVIRRVDENWAEGKLGDRIGIFPLAFVELNSVARALMKLSTNSQPGPSRVAPPTPTSEDTTPLIPTDHTRTVANSLTSRQQQQQQQQQHGTAANLGNVSGNATAVMPSSQLTHQHQISNTNLTVGSSGSNIPVPVTTSDSSSTPSSASSSTTPNMSSSNTSSSSSTAPSSPTSPPPPRIPVPVITPPPHNVVTPPPPRPAHNPNISPPHALPPHHGTPGHHAPSAQHREKRHSFSVLHTGHHHQTSHRHSAEILSPTETSQDCLSPEHTLQSQVGGSGELVQRQGSQQHRRSGSSDTTAPMVGSGLTPPPPQGAPHHIPTTQLPAAYIALYPYKPHKADELELKKGAIYTVTERCQDGWFKGTSSRAQKCGVFPGNYVTPIRSLTAGQAQLLGLTRGPNSSSTSPQQGTISGSGSCSGSPRNNPATSTPPLEPRSFTRGGSSKQGSSPHVYSPRNSQQSHSITTSAITSQIPPELPPRSCSPSLSLSHQHGSPSISSSSSLHHGSAISSSWHGQHPQQSGTFGSELTSSSTPVTLGRSHSAVMATGSTATHSFDTTSSTLGRSSGGHMSTTVAPPPNVSVTAMSSRPSDKAKEKKAKGGLMSRFTSIKKSKSPPPATYSMDNPVFDDGGVAVSPQHPVHVRSGSCPSQLLQVLPLDGSTAHHRLFGSSASSGSQRIKHKEQRPNVVMANLAHFGRSSDGSASGSSGNHRKSNSLDAGSAGDGGGGRKTNKPLFPPVRERFRCIVPYPPNSEVELELWVGDIIYVHKKREDGWYKGTQQRTGRTGLFPASFVEGC
ncbi:E3 ubiquitin-protein ligase SH3RF1 isoform X2 [Cryptotermes secundus]|uniref:E3 ubiquitin-protein ligase SH3RF1 isoform X2 n=1 Tax=Cryptotermes secundus TaxID=105785 RepID=UPI000CD7B6DD|nr:E3 ubiquitin-protein ligase SH3RF1 isoform X2 [Cryptotermes secundus]